MSDELQCIVGVTTELMSVHMVAKYFSCRFVGTVEDTELKFLAQLHSLYLVGPKSQPSIILISNASIFVMSKLLLNYLFLFSSILDHSQFSSIPTLVTVLRLDVLVLSTGYTCLHGTSARKCVAHRRAPSCILAHRTTPSPHTASPLAGSAHSSRSHEWS